jgi:hypothetical protein
MPLSKTRSSLSSLILKQQVTLQSLLFNNAASLKNNSLQRIQTPVRHTTAEVFLIMYLMAGKAQEFIGPGIELISLLQPLH